MTPLQTKRWVCTLTVRPICCVANCFLQTKYQNTSSFRNNQTWNVWLPLHLTSAEPVDRFKAPGDPAVPEEHSVHLTPLSSSLSRVIIRACQTCLRLWTVRRLGELQAWPGSVGNQRRVGLGCSVQNYRGGWRGPGCDFPGMEPVQACD